MKIKLLVSLVKIDSIKNGMCCYGLYLVCEEVFCFNLYECFNYGIVIFMIMGVICICCCLFCDVVYGKLFLFDLDELCKVVEMV